MELSTEEAIEIIQRIEPFKYSLHWRLETGLEGKNEVEFAFSLVDVLHIANDLNMSDKPTKYWIEYEEDQTT